MLVALAIFTVLSGVAGFLYILEYFHIRPPVKVVREGEDAVKRWRLLVVAALLILNLIVSGLVWYRQSQDTAFADEPPKEVVRSKTFVNEIVDLDGKGYEDCTFIDVTFRYNATAAFQFSHNRVNGPFVITTDSQRVAAVVELLKGMGLTDVPLLTGDDRHPVPNVQNNVHSPKPRTN